MTLLVATSAVHILDEGEDDQPSIRAIVEAHLFHGPYCELLCSIGENSVRAFMSNGTTLPEIGKVIRLSFDFSGSGSISSDPIGDRS